MPRWFNAVATTGTGSELLHLSSWKRYTKYQVFLTFCYNFIKIKAFAHPSPSSPVKKSKKKEENLSCFVFLKHSFWDSPFCLNTDHLRCLKVFSIRPWKSFNKNHTEISYKKNTISPFNSFVMEVRII